MLRSSSWTTLTTCWPGVRLCERSIPTSCSRTRDDEVPDDPEVDVGLEQGQADLPERLVDVGFAQPAPPAQPAEDGVEAVGQALEHCG